MYQLSLYEKTGQFDNCIYDKFSHEDICDQTNRMIIEKRYSFLFEKTYKFTRSTASFQGNKDQPLYNWMKYREGFSHRLVKVLLDELCISAGDYILDPFAGSGTTLLTAQEMGINALGIELLPHAHMYWRAKSKAWDYNIDELHYIIGQIRSNACPEGTHAFNHLTITEGAFLPSIEKELIGYVEWFNSLDISEDAKILCRTILMSLLEDISHTRKVGQSLRWDKDISRKSHENHTYKPIIENTQFQLYDYSSYSVKHLLLIKLNQIISDIQYLQAYTPLKTRQEVILGNTLYTLPSLQDSLFSAVITSPPYLNRYDYTRTYALELAFLGIGHDIFKLRQEQFSCTVENKSKLVALQKYYQSIGQEQRYHQILNIVHNNQVIAEVKDALNERYKRTELNNRGIINMAYQYFTELTFVLFELYRICKSGATIALVNDNVRYAGEIIPVDTITCNLAEQIGFLPHKIYILPQCKGNSSQQMSKFGRKALRKSIILLRKA